MWVKRIPIRCDLIAVTSGIAWGSLTIAEVAGASFAGGIMRPYLEEDVGGF
jgi:hypothetical protein